MKKNVTGQVIGAQMVSATNGAAFTGSVTVAVTGDAGTQATGSVGAGACTHEGNGYHTYAPAQAETNYDLIAFTFTGTGAIPQTIQVLTTFPQTGDSFARIGAAGAGLTNIDLPNQTMDIAGNITGNLSGSVGSVTTGVTLAASAIQAIWDALTSALTTVGSIGKLVVDNLNATISSRSSHSAADVWAAGTRTLTAATNITSTGGTTVPQTGDSFARIGAAGVSLSNIPWNASWDAEVESEVADALEATIADSIPADGTRPSIKQAVYMINQFLTDRGVSGTTMTIRKVDGSTSLFTITLNDAASPTSYTRAT